MWLRKSFGTSALADIDFTQIRPRLILPRPGGNSGVCAYVASQNGANGSLESQAVELDVGDPLAQVYTSPGSSKYPDVVVKGVLHRLFSHPECPDSGDRQCYLNQIRLHS
ncbi:hypothetical protein BDV39DRAFT_200630 [Aspergillus sergii]|uniref:Uncharacterized protein n=1 Tax=Aspergillus sergii TaxID=1034303 RepID=A0A5N6XIP1_9EURO|nr:hypothetical protein BDV39DRAFT_200630 [Aspergillus sergii]